MMWKTAQKTTQIIVKNLAANCFYCFVYSYSNKWIWMISLNMLNPFQTPTSNGQQWFYGQSIVLWSTKKKQQFFIVFWYVSRTPTLTVNQWATSRGAQNLGSDVGALLLFSRATRLLLYEKKQEKPWKNGDFTRNTEIDPRKMGVHPQNRGYWPWQMVSKKWIVRTKNLWFNMI